MRQLLLAILFLVCLFPALAQSDPTNLYTFPPIRIDTLQRKTTQPLPFDRSFTLLYDLPAGEDYDTLYIYEVAIERGERRLIVDKSRKTASAKKYLQSIEGGKTVKVNMKYLPPNTLVDLLMFTKLNRSQLEGLYEINEYLTQARCFIDQAYEDAASKYEAWQDKQQSSDYPITNRVILRPTFAEYALLFDERGIKVMLDNIASYNSVEGLPVIVDDDFKVADRHLRALEISSSHLLRLFRLKNDLPAIVRGRKKLDALEEQKQEIPFEQYFKRIDNLKSSQKMLDTLLLQIDAVLLHDRAIALNNFRKCVADLKDIIKRNEKFLSDKVKAINDALGRHKGLLKETWLLSGTEIIDLNTRSKFLLVPDLGIAPMLLRGKDNARFVPRPFIGTNIYFRPVDKTIRNKSIPYRDWKRTFSLQIGLTYGEFDSPEFKNLFNDFSILIGPSVKLNQSFRIATGAVMHRTTNKNPLITRMRVGAGFFVGFSYDVEILSNANSRSRVFK